MIYLICVSELDETPELPCLC